MGGRARSGHGENGFAGDLPGFQGAMRVCDLVQRKRRADHYTQITGVEVRRCLLENRPLAYPGARAIRTPRALASR